MRKNHATVDALLRHLAAGEDVQAFPGTKYENVALVRSAERRGLILWDKEGDRYILTPAGWNQLTPRRFGLPAVAASTAIGAAVGAAVLAFVWLPGIQWRDSAYGQATALLSQERPIAAPASAAPIEVGGRSVAPMQPSAPQQAPAAASANAATSPAAVTAPEPAPLAEQPTTEPAPVAVKHVAAKRHRRTVRHYEPNNSGWGYGNPWRTRQSADSRYGQGSYFNYR